jgi:hypothetical protein
VKDHILFTTVNKLNNQYSIMKAIRYLIFIPIIFSVIAIVFSLLPIALIGLMSLSKFWLIFLLIIFGGLAITVFQLLPGVITWLSTKISPSKTFAFYTTLIISVLLGIIKIIDYWTMHELHQDGFGIFLVIILTCLTIGFISSLSIGAGVEIFEEKEYIIRVIILIGSIIFNVGIFLAFCLLTTKICYISPDKTYSWYSGIWHGLFTIPHWIVSWFIDGIYCKAPNSTNAYGVWWYLIFIFSTLGILGGGKRRTY